jgi:hypothetical protein
MTPSYNFIANINAIITRRTSFESQFFGSTSIVFEIDIESHSLYTVSTGNKI